jgi:hypothetical protein
MSGFVACQLLESSHVAATDSEITNAQGGEMAGEGGYKERVNFSHKQLQVLIHLLLILPLLHLHLLPQVLEYPAALGLELAAAAAEVVLARPPSARRAARLGARFTGNNVIYRAVVEGPAEEGPPDVQGVSI